MADLEQFLDLLSSLSLTIERAQLVCGLLSKQILKTKLLLAIHLVKPFGLTKWIHDFIMCLGLNKNQKLRAKLIQPAGAHPEIKLDNHDLP